MAAAPVSGDDTERPLEFLQSAEAHFARLTAIVEFGSEVVIVTDTNACLVYANSSSERVLGYTFESVAGRPILELLHPDDLIEAMDALSGTVESGGVKEPFIARVAHADGHWVKFEVIATNLLEDELVQGLVFHCRDVSDRDTAESRYRQAHEYSPYPVAMIPLDGSAVHANRAFAELFATTMSDLARRAFQSLIVERDRDAALTEFHLLINGADEVEHVAFHGARSDATEFLAHARGHAIRDDLGETTGFIVGILDVTEQAAAAEELATSQARMHALVNNSADIIAILYPDGNWEASDAGTRQLGYPKGFDPDGGIFSLVHPDDLESAAEALGDVLAGTRGPEHPIELRLRAADGEYWDFECVGQNLGDLGAVGGVVITARNVTPRKQADAALREAQARFHAAFEHAPLGLAVLGLDGRIQELNPAGRTMLGISAVDVAAFPLFDNYVHPDDRRMFLDQVDERLNGTGGHRFEHRMLGDDGTEIWSLTDAALVRDATGDPLHIIVMLADITERRQSEEQLAYAATHDPLTGVLNRSAFADRLTHALARRFAPGAVAVLFLDLDRFKAVNDTYGHPAGDALLIEIAGRLNAATREADTVARLGGDEFVVLCEDLRDPQEALEIAQRVAALVEQPVELNNNVASVGASIGIAIADTEHTAEILMRNSDAAVYRAKQRGRSRVEVFDEELNIAYSTQRVLERGLRTAIETNEINISYVPIVGLVDRQTQGFQAVARWQQPDGTLLEQQALTEAAAHIGLAAVLDRVVLTSGCLEAAKWRTTDNNTDLRLHVPLAVRHLDDKGLLHGVRSALIGTSLPPNLVCIEVPEAWVSSDPLNAARILHALKEQGVSLMLTDFGSIASVLGRIRELPIDMVKLARGFFASLGADRSGRAVVGAVIAMAREQHLTVIADGVETIDDVRSLIHLDCDAGQGSFFSPPMDADRAQAWARGLHHAA